MANVNINRNSSDPSYRYKMPKLVVNFEGKGNGIKTVIVNMPEIAKSLNRPPMYPTKYLSCLLGAQLILDNKNEGYVLNGAHNSNKLQDLLDGFIQKYVLCQSCESPETILSVNKKKETIGTNCMACGQIGTIPVANDRVAAYILKNPPSKPVPGGAGAAASATAESTEPTANTSLTANEDEDDDLEAIDYGDDDDDDDFDSDSHDKKEQCQESSSQEVAQNTFEDDLGVLDDDNEESKHDDDDEQKDEDDKSNQERCKYWPACNAGSECSYYHPTKPCRAFPNCRFGSNCQYIHPPCKFNSMCARPNCPFAHPLGPTIAKRRGPRQFRALQQPVAPKCKYGFKCTNLMCKFSHQASEPCRFGANCLLETCAYSHPSDVARKRPASAFKWSAQS